MIVCAEISNPQDLKLGSCAEVVSSAEADAESKIAFDSNDLQASGVNHWLEKHATGELQASAESLDTKCVCCNICGALYSDDVALATHMQQHSADCTYVCKMCDESFSQINQLHSHVQLQHGGEGGLDVVASYECSDCGARFMHNNLLKRHVLTHKTTRRQVCDKCGCTFPSFVALNAHVQQTHGLTRSHVCSECGKSFSRSADFRRHTSRHSGDKPHACNQCSAKFAVFTDLTRHLMIHTSERPFTCDVCSRTFTRSERFKRHKCRPVS